MEISWQEVEAINASLPVVVDRLLRLLSMSTSKSLPLCAIFKVWELGLPNDFEESVITQNSHLFRLCDAHEPNGNTHVLKLVYVNPSCPIWGPYEAIGEKKRPNAGVRALEKRAAAIVYEFLSLTVEKINQFRKWFEIELNIRDLFLCHLGSHDWFNGESKLMHSFNCKEAKL
ncbi:hypothetical protein FH972_010237 [Carpinus fangiana]|uniref:PORR domain-containing protein n=1 Tax=Carpinus fangiana TaxID=176857 RepID=A0A660KUM1_9ROSI|nr:hypothetical protein FH972_010237 [Carpinus fangiana]